MFIGETQTQKSLWERVQVTLPESVEALRYYILGRIRNRIEVNYQRN